MKKLFTSFIFSAFFISSHAQVPSFDWAKQLGDPVSNVFVLSSVTDQQGSFYMAGLFAGTADFDPGNGVDTLTDAGFGDIFISKLDSSGNFQWVRQIGRESYDQASSIAIDSSNNIYITGFISRDSTDFDPGPGTYFLSNPNNGASTFVLKLDSGGNFIWAKILGPDSNSPSSIATDATGNLLITGIFGGTIDFDPGTGSENMTAFTEDIYILKLTGNGDFIWARQIGTMTTNSRAYSIAADGADNLYVTGLLLGTVDFDPGVGVMNLTSTSQFGAQYILKLTSAGDFVWANAINGSLSQTGGERATRVDRMGNLFTAGWFNNTVDFDPNAGVHTLTVSASEPSPTYLLKLDSSGAFVWAKQIADAGNGAFRAFNLDASDNLYVAGRLISVGDFDPGAAVDTLSNATGNTFIAKYDTAGALDWAINFSNSDPNNDHNVSLNIDVFGNIITTGVFSDTADFDPGIGVSNLISNSGGDLFIQKLNQSGFSSISEFESGEQGVVIFPNPNTGTFQIRMEKHGRYSIFNECGQLVRSLTVTNSNLNLISVDDLQEGIYFISGGEVGISHAKIIVIHN